MYSSFVQAGFVEIREHEFASRILSGTLSHSVTVRNPYMRLASFFADKLRENVPWRPGEWQESQKIFFPFVGVRVDDTLEVVQNALLGMEFEQFIRCLPFVREEHLASQSELLETGGVDIWALTTVYRIEDKAREFWQSIGVSNPPHANKSSKHPDITNLSQKALAIINGLYSADFTNFGYDKLAAGSEGES
jgi:hypothetical protein